MGEPDDVLAIRKISTEVDESQVKILLLNQCYKAQRLLLHKLGKKCERQKKVCKYMNTNNFKLETEIKLAEQNNKSLLVINDTIKFVNVEIKKEWLLAKERKAETIERVETGEKKYEEHWLKCKKRYESLPYVQKLQQATDGTQTLKESTKNLENKAQALIREIKMRKTALITSDRKRIIEMANFMIYELPMGIKMVKEKHFGIVKLTNQIEGILKEQGSYKECAGKSPRIMSSHVSGEKTNMVVDIEVANLSNNINNSLLMMSKLQLLNDLDVLSVKLGQIKKGDTVITASAKRTGSITLLLDRNKVAKTADDGHLSSYYNTQAKAKDYTKKKLIHILEDKKLKINDTYNILSKVNTNELKEVDVITAEDIKPQPSIEDKVNEIVGNEQIEVIDLTSSDSQNILIPPTQFLDLDREIFHNFQNWVGITKPMVCEENPMENVNIYRKRVAFDLPIQETIELSENENINANKDNETINSQMDITFGSDGSFGTIKDMMLKKHKLDLSPQFVYAKNTVLSTRNDDELVRSKFFNKSGKTDLKVHETELGADEVNQNIGEKECPVESEPENNKSNENMVPVNEVTICASKKEHDQQSEKVVSGFLYSHKQGVPESLDLSISTTGFEEGDSDFPYCIDSSVLLSPKADLPMPMSGGKAEELQEAPPSFLSGLRKTGLSFFEQPSKLEPIPDSSAPNQGSNFSFNFGAEEKKGRGGLFNMFH